jgi:AraC-like DNA-binding protein
MTDSPSHGMALPKAGLRERPVLEGSLRIGPLVGVPALLEELGVDLAAAIGPLGLVETLFSDAENMIAFPILGRLLQACVTRTGCPHFGLLLGQRMGPECLGLIGQLLPHAPDVGTALRSLVLNLHLHDRGAAPLLSLEGERAVLSYLIYRPGEGTDQINDGAMAICLNIMRSLCGPAWLPSEVLFAHRQPEDIAPFRRCFQAPLRFDREQTALVFPAKWLNQALTGADPARRQEIEQRIVALANLSQTDLVGRLRSTLRALLTTSRGSQEEVAELFSLHPRTLNRRLAEQGTSFKALVAEVRYDIACQLLANTALSVGQIATILGYGEISALTRAFRRWSGMSPQAWRHQPGNNAVRPRTGEET